MCWLTDLFKSKPEEPEAKQKPDWVTQTPEQVAEEELYAASIHLTYMELVTENPAQYPPEVYGDYAWHERWYKKHTEAAWYTAPEYTEGRLGK